MKKYYLVLLAFLFILSHSTIAGATVKVPAAYVALGDSLAAGQTPRSQIDTGYADLIAQEISRHQPLALFTKDFAYPGFGTSEVLDRINEKQTQEVLASANIITLSAGANDLLRVVQSNSREGSIQFQQPQVDFALNKARENLQEILKALREISPNADVYVMGYYFAYPHARASQKHGIAEQLDMLNKILEQEAKQADAIFVPVDQAFGENAVDKLPNPEDIHPNIKGYQAMANAFMEQYRSGWTIEAGELPPANPMSFEEIMRNMEQQSQQDIEESALVDKAALQPSEKVETEYLALLKALPYI